MAAVAIRRLELSASVLRQEAARTDDAPQARRLLALAMVLDGADREVAARTCGMDRQTLRDWVHRYNAEGVAGLRDRPLPGRKPRLTAAQEAELAALVEQGPDPASDGVVRWQRVDLQAQIERRFGIEMHERTVGKVLAKLGFRRLSVHPHHPEVDPAAQAAFKKTFADLVDAVIPPAARDKPIEIWFQDEARSGQKGTLTRIWARRGSRPPAPRDQRYDWAYLFGAVCLARRTAAAVVLPTANAEAMNHHLQAISATIAAGAHVLVIDGAGYHQPSALKCPANISLLALPPYSPQLNPVENVRSAGRSGWIRG